ncbi:threonine aldolase family protein [Maridesulfovibrio frigidus]|uniref:threonine aldolase family protein n=1 Tax=Maridesulfovibrio frigidus TaxID=340956 RepID=UPI0004E13CFE|nr:low specificity L-threonine aldolase [Maridesulfovibrio frigidus]
MRSFASDNYAGVHPVIMEAIVNANNDHMTSYGDDPVSEEAVELFKEHFGKDVKVFFMATGTATNTLILKHITNSWSSVICTDTAHITVDECGSTEAIAGVKLVHADTVDGKLSLSSIKPLLSGRKDVHQSQPSVISITQNTELGTLYTVEEIKEICDYAHSKGLWVHMDGARLANAAVALGVSFKEMTTDCGVDVLSFGGTKNGCMCAEAAVFINSELGKNFDFIRKQGMQLISKMRYMGAQFKALLSNGLWIKNATKANDLASILEQKVRKIKDVTITRPVQANAVFAIIPQEFIEPLQAQFPFYVWDEATGEVRWMTSWSTTEEDINNFVQALKKLI